MSLVIKKKKDYIVNQDMTTNFTTLPILTDGINEGLISTFWNNLGLITGTLSLQGVAGEIIQVPGSGGPDIVGWHNLISASVTNGVVTAINGVAVAASLQSSDAGFDFSTSATWVRLSWTFSSGTGTMNGSFSLKSFG